MKYFVANHKNYLTYDDSKIFIEKISNYVNNHNEIIIVPTYMYLPMYKDLNIKVGAQNFDIIEPLSGGVSLNQLKSLDLNYVIVGHSDSRWKLKESDDLISNKVKILIDNSFTPILCFGEIEEVSIEESISILETQLDNSLEKISPDDVDKIIFAYEPVWSISNGKNFSKVLDSNTLSIIMKSIKLYMKEKYLKDVNILYGGSVNINNIYDLNKIESIDGYLIGKSSIDADTFISLIDSI